MVNHHIQEIIEEQKRSLETAQANCSALYGHQVSEMFQSPYYNEASKSLMCHPFWDTISCWPPTNPGETAKIRCPEYITGFKTAYYATRVCTENSTWYINETTKEPWANYSACMETLYTTIYKDVPHSDVPANSEALLSTIKILSHTGYAISLTSLIVAFLIMILIKKLHCARNILHMNLFASFIFRSFFYILKDLLFYEGVGFYNYDLKVKNGDIYFKTDTVTNNFECKLLTTLVQFFTTANYSWILMEGVYLNNLIFRALFNNSNKNLAHYIGLGWGLPLGVIISWVIARLLEEDTTCWTMNDTRIPFFIIGIPTLISVLINLVLFVTISIVLYTKIRSPINGDAQKYRKWAKSTLVLVPLFGVHYAILLIFYFVGETTIWLVVDMLFGSFQGFFVAVLYCFLNGEVKTELKPNMYAFLTYLGSNKCLRQIFPCRQMFVRSGVERQSVCTTMSCSSLYVNGTAHRGNRSKWEILHKGDQPSLHDKSKTHVCNKELEKILDGREYPSSCKSSNKQDDPALIPENHHNRHKIAEEEIPMFNEDS